MKCLPLLRGFRSVKKTVLGIAFILMCQWAQAQTISGTVFSEGSGSVIAGATVYYGGSMAAVITGNDGSFQLTPRAQQIPITISCIGYHSVTVNYTPGKPLVVYLKPKIEALRTVVVRADGMERKDELLMFQREFLGTSVNAKSCTLINADDINFFYDKKSRTLTASCDKPIQIHNPRLGYNISYFLDQFSCNPVELLMRGDYIFKEDKSLAANTQIKQNRLEAYKGSRMHFVRQLWSYKLKGSGFTLYNQIKYPIKDSLILRTDDDRQRYVNWTEKLYVDYKGHLSMLQAQQDCFIDKDGFYSDNLRWSGELGRQRVGDLLPFDYQPGDQEPANMVAASPVGLPAVFNAAWAQAKTSSSENVYKIPFEKVYVHTDRDIYLAGDTLWFKAYLLNGQNNVPAATSNNLYTELIDPDAKIISTALIRLDDGFGHGDFWLPDSIPAGNYRLRAYTNWMRNFGDNFIFEKPLQVIRLKNSPAAKPVESTAKNVKKAAKSKPVIAAAPKTASPSIRFFPEGGSMVEGVSTIVAVKAEDANGKGMQAGGIILASSGDTLARFACNALGMGVFTLLPVNGQTYKATATLNNRQVNVELPLALKQGLALQIRQTDSLIKVNISSGPALSASADRPPPVCLVTIKHTGQALVSEQVHLQGGYASLVVPASLLPEGISAVTLYDDQNKPNCERLIYVHHPGVNPLELHTDKATYQPNQSVSLQLTAAPNSNLSLAVTDAALNDDNKGSIVSSVLLNSELRGHIEDASSYFDEHNANRYKELDLLLLTQGWRNFIWRRLADSALRISRPAEQGVSISGVVKDEARNRNLHGLGITLHANGAKGNKLFITSTDSAGRFRFNDLMLYGVSGAELSAINAKGQKRGRFYLDTLTGPPVFKNALLMTDTLSAQTTASIIQQSAKIKGATALKEVQIKARTNSVIMPDGTMYMTWGEPEQFTITSKDFEFNTLTWFVLSHSDRAKISRSPTKPGVGMMVDKYFVYPRLIWVGHERERLDTNVIWALPMDKFKTVKLQPVVLPGNRLSYYLFFTLIDNALEDNPGTITANIPGYYQARVFYEPVNSEDAQKTGYRPTVYWAPDVKTDADGHATIKFYNTAAQSVKVTVQGVSPGGTLLSKTINYQVQ